MERITYRITLDTHRTGIQRTLQGFETGNNMSRRLSINLVASGDSIEIPFDHVTAVMYVLPQDAKEPSINECTIDGNTIIYDVLPTDIATEGITEMQVKIIEGRTDGARRVLVSPKFALEVTESNIDDESVESTTTFTALEEAVAKAEGVYNSRLVSVEITDDYNFRAYYADGTYYETDALYEALHNGNALLAQSYAKGGTGIREGEDADNSMYYAGVSRSASAGVNIIADESRELLNEARLQTAYTAFNVNFETGNLDYASANYTFDVNEETGDLEAESDGSYVPEQIIGNIVNDYLEEKTAELDRKIEDETTVLNQNIEDVSAEFDQKIVDVNNDLNNKIIVVEEKADTATNIAKGRNQAHVFDTTANMQEWLTDEANKGLYNVGDNIYIVETDVPDWWISEVLEEADTETGYYYKIAQLEVQKVDLTNYLSTDDILDTMEEIEENTQGNKPVGALALKEVISSLYTQEEIRQIVGMKYDPATDIKYLKNQDGEWVLVGYGGLLLTYLYTNEFESELYPLDFSNDYYYNDSYKTNYVPTKTASGIQFDTTYQVSSVVGTKDIVDLSAYKTINIVFTENGIEKELTLDITNVNEGYVSVARNSNVFGIFVSSGKANFGHGQANCIADTYVISEQSAVKILKKWWLE